MQMVVERDVLLLQTIKQIMDPGLQALTPTTGQRTQLRASPPNGSSSPPIEKEAAASLTCFTADT